MDEQRRNAPLDEQRRNAPPAGRRRARERALQVTERDRELLGFVAEQRLVLASHVRALLDTSQDAASARLRALSGAGLLRQETRFHRQPACYQITRAGLAVIGSELPKPNLDLRSYAHDIGLAWLWLAARAGTFGQLREIVSERQLRSRDARPDRRDKPLAVRLGGVGANGRDRLHYPDLLLHTTGGQRVALELELSGKGRTRRETILAGYGADARFDAVLYLVNRPGIARELRASASRLGISSLVHVQHVAWGASMSVFDGAGTARARTSDRAAEAGR